MSELTSLSSVELICLCTSVTDGIIRVMINCWIVGKTLKLFYNCSVFQKQITTAGPHWLVIPLVPSWHHWECVVGRINWGHEGKCLYVLFLKQKLKQNIETWSYCNFQYVLSGRQFDNSVPSREMSAAAQQPREVPTRGCVSRHGHTGLAFLPPLLQQI